MNQSCMCVRVCPLLHMSDAWNLWHDSLSCVNQSCMCVHVCRLIHKCDAWNDLFKCANQSCMRVHVNPLLHKCDAWKAWHDAFTCVKQSCMCVRVCPLVHKCDAWNGLFKRVNQSCMCFHVCWLIHMCGKTLLGGYCSTVQGLLDWFEVDLGFTELLFIQIELCVDSFTCVARLFPPKNGLIALWPCTNGSIPNF